MQLLIQRSLEALRARQNLQKMGQIPGFLLKFVKVCIFHNKKMHVYIIVRYCRKIYIFTVEK